MSDSVVSFSTEQFDQLLGVLQQRGGAAPEPTGLGADPAAGLAGAPRVLGLGCGDGGMGSLAASVYTMLAMGSPRLALAKAKGIPLAPYMINVRATFPDTSTSIVPDVGSDVKITQDTFIDSMIVRTENQSVTANQNQFQAQSDFYYGIQSGIEVTLDVQGAPRYTVAPKFMPVSNLMDAINGGAHRGMGWILTYQQQLFMSFQAKVTIPTAPIEVICTFSGWVPVWDELVAMTNREAIKQLREDCGFQIDDSYAKRCCR